MRRGQQDSDQLRRDSVPRYNFLDQDDMTLGVQAGANISKQLRPAVGPFISFDLDFRTGPSTQTVR